jgi:drug/metabolite transporter (DMT)-like permease
MGSEERQNPILGIAWMVVAGFCFVAVTALVKFLGGRIPAPESAFLRYLLGLAFLAPMIRPMLAVRLDRATLRLVLLRGAFHTAAVMLWFYAMSRIPIAEVTAMNYLNPVYVTIGGVLVLGERLAARRITALVAAFIGVLMILRPGFRSLDPGHFAMLVTAACFGGSYLVAKVMSGRMSPAAVVGFLSVTVTIGLAPFAFAAWVTPTPREIAILFGVALFATAGHYAMTLAFRAAPVTVTQPATFLQLVWAVALGRLVFGEPVDPWVIAGGAIILASVTFITWREAVARRRSLTPPVLATKV